MQFFREDRAGNRVPVKEYEYLADKQSKNYRQVHAFGVMIVYQMT